MQHYLAIDIGGTSIKYGVVRSDGTLLSNKHVPTPATWDGLLEQVDVIFNETTAEARFDGIGFSAPGAVDSTTGVIHGISALPYIHDRPFLQAFKERYDLPVE
ncbi:ROK family protein [Exiguobacterium sp. s149]|uniref:ROK family protein n=1 Tax=Exiguobacterium TaxID=33986 RepID=UPI001BEC4798|nr:ROK family protein [Exiguobacterium sp. s149]